MRPSPFYLPMKRGQAWGLRPDNAALLAKLRRSAADYSRQVSFDSATGRTFRHRKIDGATADLCRIQTQRGSGGVGLHLAATRVRVVWKQRGNRAAIRDVSVIDAALRLRLASA